MADKRVIFFSDNAAVVDIIIISRRLNTRVSWRS